MSAAIEPDIKLTRKGNNYACEPSQKPKLWMVHLLRNYQPMKSQIFAPETKPQSVSKAGACSYQLHSLLPSVGFPLTDRWFVRPLLLRD